MIMGAIAAAFVVFGLVIVPEDLVLDFARLEYAAFVGAQVVWPTAGRDELSKMDAAFQRLVHGALGGGA